ncbi:IS3 family transposase [Bacillota bacterium Lsc_1132]
MRERRTFKAEFKDQMVKLYENGKPRKDIISEYDLTPSALDKWIKQRKKSGSFKEKDNRSPEENELIVLRKENKRLLMENDILKQAALILGDKSKCDQNRHKYSISAMCDVLQLSRSTYYYESKEQSDTEDELTEAIKDIFQKSRQNYGTRKIKPELKKLGIIASRRRIGRIMKENSLVSNYTVAQFKPHVDKCNESKVENVLKREFDQEKELTVVVSDLTYVRVEKSWHYICLFVDLYNREIIGHSAGANKDAQLVYQALSTVKADLRQIQLFHTDRGNEFKNKTIDEALDTFNIKRSLSMKGCPYDNAVAEATFKIIKTEFVKGKYFESLEQLKLELDDYVHWFNHIRIHGTLGYLSPIEFKEKHL